MSARRCFSQLVGSGHLAGCVRASGSFFENSTGKGREGCDRIASFGFMAIDPKGPLMPSPVDTYSRRSSILPSVGMSGGACSLTARPASFQFLRLQCVQALHAVDHLAHRLFKRDEPEVVVGVAAMHGRSPVAVKLQSSTIAFGNPRKAFGGAA